MKKPRTFGAFFRRDVSRWAAASGRHPECRRRCLDLSQPFGCSVGTTVGRARGSLNGLSGIHHRIGASLGGGGDAVRTFVVETRIGRHTHLHRTSRLQISQWIVGLGRSLGVVTRLHVPRGLGRPDRIDLRIGEVRRIGIETQLIARRMFGRVRADRGLWNVPWAPP